MNRLNHLSYPKNLTKALKLMGLALMFNLQSSEKNITPQPAKSQIAQTIEHTKVPFETINQTTYTTYEALANDIHDCGLIQTLSRADYIHQLQQDSTLNLKPETRDLLTHLDSTEYSPKHNEVVRQIIYETLFDHLKHEAQFPQHQGELTTVAQVVTSQLHKSFDPKNKQISEYMQIQRVDPSVWQSLNQETICAIFDQIKDEEERRNISKQIKIRKGLAQAPTIAADTDSLDVKSYYENGMLKYSWNFAADTLAQNNIKLRSTNKKYNEIGNNQSTGRTSLVGINAHTVNYTIARKRNIDTKYGDSGKWFDTGGTEGGDHAPGAHSHPNGFKKDIRGRGIQALLLAMEYGATNIGDTNKVYDPETGLMGSFTYHGPNYHMDIKVVPSTDLAKN